MRDVVRVPVWGHEAEFLVRIPDTPDLIAGQWLPLPLYAAINAPTEDEPVWIRPSEDDQTAERLDRLDDWLVLVCVAPKVTRDRAAASGDTLHVSDLDAMTKRRIWARTYVPLVDRMDAHAKTSSRLFDDTATTFAVDVTARRYGQRPSELVGLTDAGAAFDFDMAVCAASMRYERRLRAADADGRH